MGLLRNAEDAKHSFYYTTLPPRAAGVDGKYWKLKKLKNARRQKPQSSLLDRIGPEYAYLQTLTGFSVGHHRLGAYLLLPFVNCQFMSFRHVPSQASSGRAKTILNIF